MSGGGAGQGSGYMEKGDTEDAWGVAVALDFPSPKSISALPVFGFIYWASIALHHGSTAFRREMFSCISSKMITMAVV